MAQPLERAVELEQLSTLLAAARDGHGRVCVIDGPSGVGKSRLLDACADSAAVIGMSVLRARCSELTRDYPFGVASALFEGLLMRCGEQARAQFMGGPAALSEPVFGRGAAADEYTVIHGLYWLTLNMAEQRPVAILIDDVPWADDFSLRFLAYLAEKLDNAHVALVVVVRTGDPGAESELVGHLWESASVPTIRPAELSESAVADLLAVSLPSQEVDPDLVRTVFEDTRGNPLLVVAVADAIAAGEDADLTTPESVRRHIARRLGRLHPVLRQFVKAASVLGDNAAFVDVTRLANLESDQALAAAEQLAAAEVLASTEPIAFAHRLVRTATYDFLSPAERTALHERAARQLSANRAQPETVAEHLMLCGPIHEPWALAVLHAAGCAVARKGAHAAAVRYLRRAVDGADLGAVAARVLIDLGLAEAAAGEPTSLDRFEHALDLVSGPADRADALYSLGQTLYRIGRYAEAGVAFRRGARLFETGDRQVRLRFEGAAFAAEYHLEPANRGRLSPINAEAQDDGPGDRAMLAFRALSEVLTSPPAGPASDLALRALGNGALLAEQTAEGPSVNLATLALLNADRLIEAHQAAEATIRDARMRGLLAYAEASLVRGLVLYARGRITDAAVDAQVAWDVMRCRSHAHAHTALGTLVHCMIERDELDEAADLMREAAELIGPPRAPAISALMHVARGRLHLKRKNIDAAQQDLRRAEDAMRGYGALNPSASRWRSLAGVIAHHHGDETRARELIDEEIRLAEWFQTPISLGIALRRRALTETGNQGIDSFQDAINALRVTDAQLDLARAHAGLGQVLRRAGQRIQARHELSTAVDLAHRCGATGFEAEVREELTAAGARPRRPAVSGVESLTPTELRVAQFAAEGLSNTEIAESLFVSPNTIAWHLGNIYRKLHVGSRDEVKRCL